MPGRLETDEIHYNTILTKYFAGMLEGNVDKNKLNSALTREEDQDIQPFTKERIFELLPHQNKAEELVQVLEDYYVKKNGVRPEGETGFVAVVTQEDKWMIGMEDASGNVILGGIYGFWPNAQEIAITLREDGEQKIKPISVAPEQNIKWVGYNADYQPINPQST